MRIIGTDLELIEVWATVVEGREYSYEDIYDDEEDARSLVGKLTNDEERIVDVKQGWFIKGTDDLDEISEDIYFYRSEALEDLEERILPNYEKINGR